MNQGRSTRPKRCGLEKNPGAVFEARPGDGVGDTVPPYSRRGDAPRATRSATATPGGPRYARTRRGVWVRRCRDCYQVACTVAADGAPRARVAPCPRAQGADRCIRDRPKTCADSMI